MSKEMFKIIFLMLWFMASEIRNKPVDNEKFNDLWVDFQKIINS
jgi:hypothetical protein